jgi:hypothetical protein
LVLGLGHYPESAAGAGRGVALALLVIGIPLVGYAAGLALPDVWERASLVLVLSVGWSVNARLRRDVR